MTLKEAIRAWCGISISLGPPDGKVRKFRIDQLRNGFLIRFPDCALFGSVIDGEWIRFDGYQYWMARIEHKRSKAIAFEWLAWEAGRSAIDNAIVLSREDSERLALAVERLESWL